MYVCMYVCMYFILELVKYKTNKDIIEYHTKMKRPLWVLVIFLLLSACMTLKCRVKENNNYKNGDEKLRHHHVDHVYVGLRPYDGHLCHLYLLLHVDIVSSQRFRRS